MSDIFHLPITAFAVIALLVLYTIHILRRKHAQHRISVENNCQPVPKLPSKDPFFGLDRIFESIRNAKAHILLERSYDRFVKHGHTFRNKRFLTPVIITREPQNIKTILSLKFKDYGLGSRIDSFGPLLGHGIFTTDGAHWAQSRAMIRPNFVREQVADLEIFEEQMGDLFAMIPDDGDTVDLQELFFCYTIDSATEFLFGQSVRSLKRRREGVTDVNDFPTAFNYAQFAIANAGRLGPLRVFFRNRRAEECNRICHEFVEGFVDMALKYRAGAVDEEEKMGAQEKKRRYVFLEGLAEQTGDRRRIRDEVMNVLLAGRDTTASLLSNMFFMLAKNPRVWNKLREEIASLNGRPPAYEQLRNLKYLKYCINESLRVHPVVPVNARYAKTDTVLPVGGGPTGEAPVFVPRGATVAYSVWSMHRREDIYGPDAHEYRPERWEHIRPSWEYLPFNGGPRICVGQQYALTEAAYVTARLAQRFSQLESRDPGPWEESLTLTLCSRNGTRVSLK